MIEFDCYLNGGPLFDTLGDTGTFDYYLNGGPILTSGSASAVSVYRRTCFIAMY
jgi:hypothetical protein